MGLCHFCAHALSTLAPPGSKNVSIHNTFQSFVAAVDEGCYVCQELFRQAPDEWKQELRRRVQISGSSAEEQPTTENSEAWLTGYKRPGQHGSRSGYLFLDLGCIVLKPDVSLGKVKYPSLVVCAVAAEPLLWDLTSPTTNSEETFTKIKSWFEKCRKTHIKCLFRRQQADVGWQPTRLVEVTPEPRTSDHTDNIRCRLVELGSENAPQDLKYITLSHRWPQNLQGFQKLTVDKLPLWKDNLPIGALSQTFRDAFLVAYKLGISYVWIDSLCIIQDGDDYADWRKEAPWMYKVYSNAEFNICAAKNNQVEHYGGLFSPRPPSAHVLQFMSPMIVKGKITTALIRHEMLAFGERWSARMNDSPLASRGWVFQEQLLSRANIHFCDQEVLFECPEMRASEYMGSDQDYHDETLRVSGHNDAFFKEHLPIRDVIRGELATSSVSSYCGEYDYHEFVGATYDEYLRWHRLLSQYTTLQLTKPDDRLVALSGVAQYFKRLFLHDDYYIAGLWRSRLPTEMLWQLPTESPREDWEKRNNPQRHFTFSWISVKGTVENRADPAVYRESIRNLAELEPIKYRSSPETMDAIGGEGQPLVEDIFSLPLAPTVEIRITGFLRPVNLKNNEPATAEERKRFPGIRWNENPEGLGLHLLLDPLGKRRVLEGGANLDFEIGPSEVTALNESGRLHLMPLMGSQGDFKWILLLEILETSDGENMGRFRRVGVHEHVSTRPVDEWLVEYILSEDVFNTLPCWQYDEVSKQHTIFVI